MRLGGIDRAVDAKYPPDPFPGRPVFALFALSAIIADPSSLAPNARQKTVWEHYNEIAKYIDFDREHEWGDVADSTLVFVSESSGYIYTVYMHCGAYTLL